MKGKTHLEVASLADRVLVNVLLPVRVQLGLDGLVGLALELELLEVDSRHP